jgi:hypothetical protein
MAYFSPKELDAATGKFISMGDKFGGYLKSAFGDWNFEDVKSFKITREATDEFGFTPFNVTLKLSSGKEISLKQRLDETYTGENIPPSGKFEARVDQRQYSENKGLASISEYVPASQRAAQVAFKKENPRGSSDYSESDSRWGMRAYTFRNPSQGRSTGLDGDIPFTGRTSYGTRTDQLFINGFPVDEQGRRLTMGGNDPRYGTINTVIIPVDYDKNPIQTPIVADPGSLEGQSYFVDGVAGVYGPSDITSTDARGMGRTYTALDGLDFTDQQAFATYQSALMADKRAQLAAERETTYVKAGEKAGRQSAFDSLYNEMSALGLGSLVDPLRGFIEQDIPPSEFAIKLRDTEAYKKRFIANETRRNKGLRALSPGEYIKNEDAYRQAIRAYGLSQFDNDQYVTQFIENDISPTELSNRLSLAVDRVQNADPAIARTLRDYYGITQQDLVGYVLDPQQQRPALERKVATAEIGAAARIQGIEPGAKFAQDLAIQGVTQAEAQRGYAKIAGTLPTAEKLSQIYGATMEGYDLTQAEQEEFNQLASAKRRRERLTEREIAEFSGRSGVARGSLDSPTGGQY